MRSDSGSSTKSRGESLARFVHHVRHQSRRSTPPVKRGAWFSLARRRPFTTNDFRNVLGCNRQACQRSVREKHKRLTKFDRTLSEAPCTPLQLCQSSSAYTVGVVHHLTAFNISRWIAYRRSMTGPPGLLARQSAGHQIDVGVAAACRTGSQAACHSFTVRLTLFADGLADVRLDLLIKISRFASLSQT